MYLARGGGKAFERAGPLKKHFFAAFLNVFGKFSIRKSETRQKIKNASIGRRHRAGNHSFNFVELYPDIWNNIEV